MLVVVVAGTVVVTDRSTVGEGARGPVVHAVIANRTNDITTMSCFGVKPLTRGLPGHRRGSSQCP